MARWATILALSLATPAAADEHLRPEPSGPLAGKTIVVSPGHGYLDEGGTWSWQRGIVYELREDVHTNEIVIEHLQRLLVNAGARVESVRERSFNTNEVIVDNGGAGYRETGAWTSSTSVPDFYGAGYRWAQVAAQPTATAEFAPTFPAAGRYPVYVWFTKGQNRARDARFVVHHTGGETTVVIDQSDLGDHWLFLGDFHFAAGAGGKVVLTNQGADAAKVVIADAVRFGGGVGRSGQPRWREAAHEFLEHKGFFDAAGDVTIRPIYATYLAGGDTTRWRDDFLYFALHTNAGGGQGLSTFSYSNGRTAAWGTNGAVTYPTSPSPLQTVSDRLRSTVHAQVLADIRATHSPSWQDRGVHLMNFGELREARNMPSTLLELGFHDSAVDADLLRDPSFRAAAARAIYKGILRFWRGASATVLPLAPANLRLENLGQGQVRVRWDAVSDPLEPSAVPTAYKVYTSSDGRGFDDGVVVSGTEHVVARAPGDVVFVKVAALNAGGESLCSRTGGARVGATSSRLLVVDGFDREYRHTEANIRGRFTYDYAVEHVAALAGAVPDRAIDFAENEVVAGSTVALASYAAVDWLLGREASATRTFDPTEQSLCEGYLAAGGKLLVSGTEVGWDLEAQGGGTRFLNAVLGARYVSDDSGAFAARGRPGSPLAGVPLLGLEDGTRGYGAFSTDVLAPAAGAEALLAYETAGAPTAGVGVAGKTVVLGFPIEAVRDDAARGALVHESVAYLSPTLVTPLATGPVAGGGGGGGTAPGGGSGTVAPGATPGPTTVSSGGGSGGGGCSLGTGDAPASGGALWLLGLVALVALRRRAV